MSIVGRAQMLEWGWTEAELDVLRNLCASDCWMRRALKREDYEPGPDGIWFTRLDRRFFWPRGTIVPAVEPAAISASPHWCPAHAYAYDASCLGCGGERIATRSMDVPRVVYSEHQAEAEQILAVLLDPTPPARPTKPVEAPADVLTSGTDVLVKRKKGAPLPGQKALF